MAIRVYRYICNINGSTSLLVAKEMRKLKWRLIACICHEKYTISIRNFASFQLGVTGKKFS